MKLARFHADNIAKVELIAAPLLFSFLPGKINGI